MKIQVLLPDGRRLELPASQVVVMTDEGVPFIAGYTLPGGITKAAHSLDADWGETCGAIGISPQSLPVVG